MNGREEVNTMAGYSLICCVVDVGSASKVLRYARQHSVKGGTISIGREVVNNHLLELLALNEEQKEIITMVVERELAHGIILDIRQHLSLEKPHHGIAFSYPVSEFTGSKNEVGTCPEEDGGAKGMYKIIYVVVDKGRGEDVIAAAGKAGVKSGIIINARGAGIHEVQKLFSMDIEPEKEEVFVIAKTEMKERVIQSINDALKIDEPGNGIMFILDVDEMYGLHGK